MSWSFQVSICHVSPMDFEVQPCTSLLVPASLSTFLAGRLDEVSCEIWGSLMVYHTRSTVGVNM